MHFLLAWALAFGYPGTNPHFHATHTSTSSVPLSLRPSHVHKRACALIGAPLLLCLPSFCKCYLFLPNYSDVNVFSAAIVARTLKKGNAKCGAFVSFRVLLLSALAFSLYARTRLCKPVETNLIPLCIKVLFLLHTLILFRYYYHYHHHCYFCHYHFCPLSLSPLLPPPSLWQLPLSRFYEYLFDCAAATSPLLSNHATLFVYVY